MSMNPDPERMRHINTDAPIHTATPAPLYASLWDTFGAIAEGVGWRNKMEQDLRFKAMLMGNHGNVRSVMDVGCGYGALVPYLNTRHEAWFQSAGYIGVDSNPYSLSVAQENHHGHARMFIEGDIRDLPIGPETQCDLVVGCGVLAWYEMPQVLEILDAMWARTRVKGAMVFMLKQAHEYWGDLGFILPRFQSKNWRVQHDYGLDEVCVKVRKA